MAGVALAAGANATTVAFTDSFGLATTNWTHLLGASQFNPALGTLNSATFTGGRSRFFFAWITSEVSQAELQKSRRRYTEPCPKALA